MDETKVHAIIMWPTLKSLHDIHSFHGLASFYRHFICNFRNIVASITECVKGGNFLWTKTTNKAFEDLKHHVMSTLVLALPNFNDMFQVECDASVVGISIFLI